MRIIGASEAGKTGGNFSFYKSGPCAHLISFGEFGEPSISMFSFSAQSQAVPSSKFYCFCAVRFEHVSYFCPYAPIHCSAIWNNLLLALPLYASYDCYIYDWHASLIVFLNHVIRYDFRLNEEIHHDNEFRLKSITAKSKCERAYFYGAEYKWL